MALKQPHRRRWRAAALEHATGLAYGRVRSLARRAGVRLRSKDDRALTEVVCAQLATEVAQRRARAEAIAALALELGRSQRWVKRELARGGLSASRESLCALLEVRDSRERVRRVRIGRCLRRPRRRAQESLNSTAV
ncbi:MAG: hypothetical protein Q8Q09_06040 [Deltaproteobacteria bacterium]|nr:hypothetical protein [Deltaproteobacteria bacterium]